MHKSLALALILALAAPAAADDYAKTIAPFLDEHTFAVARLDLAKVNAEALFTAFGPYRDIDSAGAKFLQAKADRWLTEFTKAGGREMFLVFSLADSLRFPFLVVPLPEGADVKTMAQLLNWGIWQFHDPGEKLGAVMVAGDADTRKRLRTVKPVARPELAKAFAAAGDGVVQFAFIPPPHLIRVFDEMMPVLPKEIGGGSSKALTRGLQWAALGLDAPPKLTLRLTIQAENAKAATALNDAIGKAVQALAERKSLHETLPDLDKALAPLTPKVEEDRLVLTLDEKQTRALAEPWVRQIIRAVAVEEASKNLKQVALAIINYADSHMGPMVTNISKKGGKPLLSWRVAMLPYLGQEALYKQFHLDEPWDSEHNKKLLAKMPQVYAGRNAKLNEQGKTVLLAPTGEETAWPGTPIIFPGHFADGLSQTILLVLADDDHAVEWTKPDDLKIDPKKPQTGLGQLAGRFVFAMADSSIHTSKPTISTKSLWAMFTAHAGDIIGVDWDD